MILGASQYNQSSTGGHCELPSTASLLVVTLGASQYSHSLLLVTLGAFQYHHSLLLVTLGAFQYHQSSTGGHWELPSTTTVFYWWTLGAAQYNHNRKASENNLLYLRMEARMVMSIAEAAAHSSELRGRETC